MLSMHTLQDERALDIGSRTGDLPALTTIDRLALRLGLHLILWGQRHAEQAERAEQARSARAAEHAHAARDAAREHRLHAGPTW